MRPRLTGLIAATAMLILDQAHKIWMLEYFGIGGRAPIHVLPVLDIVLVWNNGISYSLLRADTPLGRMALLAFALAAVAVLAVWLWRCRRGMTGVALGLIIGGALGNARDRWSYGAVADFFHFFTPFPLGPLSNYVFNLADVGIVAGVGLLLYESVFLREARPDAASP